jgi:hypothetical protein
MSCHVQIRPPFAGAGAQVLGELIDAPRPTRRTRHRLNVALICGGIAFALTLFLGWLR